MVRKIRVDHNLGTKNTREKEEYFKFIHTNELSDSTVEESHAKIDISNSSSFNNEQPKKVSKSRKKSWKYRLSDYFSKNFVNNLIIGIIGAIIFALISWIFTSINDYREGQRNFINSSSEFEESIQEINERQDSLEERVYTLDKNFEILKVELAKDINYLKDLFNTYIK